MATLEKDIAQLIKLMKKEYEEVLKIENITNDIENVLKRNDKVSTEMFLNMRMEVFETIDGIKGEIEKSKDNSFKEILKKIIYGSRYKREVFDCSELEDSNGKSI